jgi:hypothetical protein
VPEGASFIGFDNSVAVLFADHVRAPVEEVVALADTENDGKKAARIDIVPNMIWRGSVRV